MRIAIAQQNPTIGDLEGTVEKCLAAHARASAEGADLVVLPELALTGYPPRDLLDQPSFVRDAIEALRSLVGRVRGPAMLLGAVVADAGDPLRVGERIANGAVLIADGAVAACHRKLLLPTYDIFDEARYFSPGREVTVASLRGKRLGLTVCEDIWNDKDYWEHPRYERDPVSETVAAGAEVILNISASPYDRHKPAQRSAMLRAMARGQRRPVLYANQVGGQDGLVFDGRSVAVDARGDLQVELTAFEEDFAVVTLEADAISGPRRAPPRSWEEDVLAALTLGLRDYVRKCGFSRAVLGLSGGIDSALTAAIAVRALGPGNVIGVAMPSRYSSQHSIDDALELGKRLGVRVDLVPIDAIFQSYLDALATPFAGLAQDVTEENLQARVRGALLMAYSNKLGALLLTTGNKSELAVGYSTLYGDMCGGLAVISDLYKNDVYALSGYINAAHGDPIPKSSLEKPPSAELRPNQRDDDSLPPYDLLDPVLHAYIDEQRAPADIVARGADAALVQRVVTMVDRAEYKRRQMPPGLRVSRKAFGEGRRLPIAQRYKPFRELTV